MSFGAICQTIFSSLTFDVSILYHQSRRNIHILSTCAHMYAYLLTCVHTHAYLVKINIHLPTPMELSNNLTAV